MGGGGSGEIHRSIWGCDSVDQAHTTSSGVTLATRVQNFFDAEGGDLTWFARYFRPSHFSITFETDASAEVAALKAAGFNFVLPISAPGSVETNKDYAAGFANGTSTCDSINGLAEQQKVYLPSKCHVYLNIEAGQPFKQGYWNGWSEAIYTWTTNAPLKGPFWPGCYCSPDTTQQSMPCPKLSSGPWAPSTSVWSSTPSTKPCAENFCRSPYLGPRTPDLCEGGPPTLIWQYALAQSPPNSEPPNCGSTCQCRDCRAGWFNFDLDKSSGIQTDNMIHLYPVGSVII
jgi:hypothetical protein